MNEPFWCVERQNVISRLVVLMFVAFTAIATLLYIFCKEAQRQKRKLPILKPISKKFTITFNQQDAHSKHSLNLATGCASNHHSAQKAEATKPHEPEAPKNPDTSKLSKPKISYQTQD